MTKQYMIVPAKALKAGDRIVGYNQVENLNLTIEHVQWDNMPYADYKCIRSYVTHQNGDEEFLYLRAWCPVHIFREPQ